MTESRDGEYKEQIQSLQDRVTELTSKGQFQFHANGTRVLAHGGTTNSREFGVSVYLDHLNKGDIERKIWQIIENQAAREHETYRHNDGAELFGTRAELFPRIDRSCKSRYHLCGSHCAYTVPEHECCCCK
jgi:hypothetical protein